MRETLTGLRQKMGIQRADKKTLKYTIGFRVDEAMAKAIVEKASAMGIKETDWLREAVKKALDNSPL